MNLLFLEIKIFSAKKLPVAPPPCSLLKLTKSFFRMMSTIISKAFSAYTFSIANIIRARYFFDFLIQSCKTVKKREMVKKIKARYYDPATRTPLSRIQQLVGAEVFADCLKKSGDKCLKEASKRCSQDEGLGECIVCYESKANYYLIHGGTAHKCMCSVCAMKLALLPPTFGRPSCPSCREPVWLFLESASSTLPCVCNQQTCRRHLVVANEKFGKCSSYRASFECSTCTLEAALLSSSMVYELF